MGLKMKNPPAEAGGFEAGSVCGFQMPRFTRPIPGGFGVRVPAPRPKTWPGYGIQPDRALFLPAGFPPDPGGSIVVPSTGNAP